MKRFGICVLHAILLIAPVHIAISSPLSKPQLPWPYNPNLESLIFLDAGGSNNTAWLLSGRIVGEHFIQLSHLHVQNRVYVTDWMQVFAGGYNPEIVLTPRWTFNNLPILMFRYNLGAGWQKFTLVGISSKGPTLLQQIDGGSFDVAYRTNNDGNGDLRAADTDAPYLLHCYDWVQKQSKFQERACKTTGMGTNTP